MPHAARLAAAKTGSGAASQRRLPRRRFRRFMRLRLVTWQGGPICGDELQAVRRAFSAGQAEHGPGVHQAGLAWTCSTFPMPPGWETWLATRHAVQTEAWLRIAKRHSGIVSVTL